MRITLNNIIYFCLLSLPITFKIQVFNEVYLYPQELIIALSVALIILFDAKQVTLIPKFISPFFYYFLALAFVVISTLFSFTNYIDITGLFKALKYLLYIVAFLILSRNKFENFVPAFNKVALLSLLITLTIYVVKWYEYPGTTSAYFYLSTWDVNYVPSGLSNLNLSLSTMTFLRSSGNHGIYGSYLVLVYLLNLHLLLSKKSAGKLSILLIILVIVNLSLLTSRETLLIFLFVNLCFFFKDLLRLRIKKLYLYFVLALSVFLILLLINGVNVGLINKLQYTIRSFSESGGEQNINLRFNVWALIILSYVLYPFHLIIGYGYNHTNFNYYLKETNSFFSLYEHYASVPESLFFIMLSYGGIFGLLCILIFFLKLIINTYKLRHHSSLHELFFYFVIALFITNNTGGSLISDLFLAQFSLFYIFIFKLHEQKKAVVHYSESRSWWGS